MTWNAYDPRWLVDLAGEQRPDLPWLAQAFARCTRAAGKSERRRRDGHRVREVVYLYFVSPDQANQPGSEWQFEGGIQLRHSVEGIINADVLTNHRVGGVEFYDRLFRRSAAEQ